VSRSTGPTDMHPADDLAAYALDALDDAERQAVEAHVAGCPDCQAKLGEFHETLVALVPEEAPPSTVWQGIAASIGTPDLGDPLVEEEVDAGPAGLATGRGEPGDGGTVVPLAERTRFRRRFQLGLAAAAACLVVAAIAGGAVGYLLGASDDSDIDSLALEASDADGVLATLTDQEGQPVARVVSDEDGAYMLLEGLENLPEGQAYQLWSLTEEQPVSLGMLGREGTNTVAFRLPPTITELAISVERTSGDVAPTTELFASGEITSS
jgi:anti-sigma-K factor RskA